MAKYLILTEEGQVRAQSAARKASIPPWVRADVEIPDEEDSLRVAFSSGASLEANQNKITLSQAYSRIKRGFEYAELEVAPEELINFWKVKGWVIEE